jgi:hypothetical protein
MFVEGAESDVLGLSDEEGSYFLRLNGSITMWHLTGISMFVMYERCWYYRFLWRDSKLHSAQQVR